MAVRLICPTCGKRRSPRSAGPALGWGECGICRRARSQACVVYDRNASVGEIPANLLDRLGQEAARAAKLKAEREAAKAIARPPRKIAAQPKPPKPARPVKPPAPPKPARPEFDCLRCGTHFSYRARSCDGPTPASCARCKSRYWNVPRPVFSCILCGGSWRGRGGPGDEGKAPISCNLCHKPGWRGPAAAGVQLGKPGVNQPSSRDAILAQ